jgi:hypothetical protein
MINGSADVNKSSARAAWASAAAASLSAVVAIITVIILVRQTNAMREQVAIMQQQVIAAYSTLRYNKQIELSTQFDQDYKTFTHLAYYAPYYARLDKKSGTGSSTEWLTENLKDIKKRSDQISTTVGLFEIWFPKNVFDWAEKIAGEIDGQVDDYNTMIKQRKVTPDNIINNVKNHAKILAGNENQDYKDYLNESPYTKKLRACFNKTLSQGHPVMDDQTAPDCDFGPRPE